MSPDYTTWHYANWGAGHLVDGKGNQAQFLILGIVLAAVWFLLTAMFVYYLVQFIRTRSNTKIYGRTMLYVNLGLDVLELVLWVLILAFWADGPKVFSQNQENYGALQDYHTLVALVVIGFVDLVAIIIMMWFFLPYYGIAFDGKRILFMGEDIPYKSITKIVIDDKTKDTYVNYTRGKRAHKRLRFSAASAFGLFVQKNADLTGAPVEETDEKAYYRTLVTQDRREERAHNEEINKKIKDKSSRDNKDK